MRQRDQMAARAVRAGLTAIEAKARGRDCDRVDRAEIWERPLPVSIAASTGPERGSAIGLREQPPLLKRIERWTIERVMAIGLYVTPDGKIMVAYGARQIPLSCAQYKANGYKPSFEKLLVKSPKATVPSVSVLPSTLLGREAGRRV